MKRLWTWIGRRMGWLAEHRATTVGIITIKVEGVPEANKRIESLLARVTTLTAALCKLDKVARGGRVIDSYEELAVMEGVDIGMRDRDTPVLWFFARMPQGTALQVLDWDQAKRLIEDAKVHSVRQLNEHTCVVETDGRVGGLVRFVRLC